MNPYWRSSCGRYTLYHGNATEVLSDLPACLDPVFRFGAMITDPPYSSGGNFRSDRHMAPSAKYRGWSQDENGKSVAPAATYSEFAGDHRDQRGHLVWCSLWMAKAAALMVPGAVVASFTDWRQLPVMSDALQCGGFVWRGVVVWDKGVGRPVAGRFRNHLEYVVWGSLGPMRDAESVYPSALIRATPPGPSDRVHLTQKPPEVVSHILPVSSGPVLDPFVGSGSTAVACVRAGREFVGIEIEERYCEIAAKRIEQEASHLFAEAV